MSQVIANIVDINEGIIMYKTEENDFLYEGEYTVNAHVVFNNGSQITGSSHTFTVHPLFG